MLNLNECNLLKENANNDQFKSKTVETEQKSEEEEENSRNMHAFGYKESMPEYNLNI